MFFFGGGVNERILNIKLKKELVNFIFTVKETKKFGFCSKSFFSLNRLKGVNTKDINNKNIWLGVSKSTSQDRGMKFREKWLFSSELTLFLETEVKILQWQFNLVGICAGHFFILLFILFQKKKKYKFYFNNLFY